MPTTYPAVIDTVPDAPNGNVPLGASAPKHTEMHQKLTDVVNALEVTLGVNPQGGAATVSDRIAALEYFNPAVSSISNTVGTVEIGTTITALTMNWSLNKTVTSQSFDQGIGSINAALRTLALSSLSLTSDKTYTLTVSDGSHSANGSTSVLFRHRRRWGTSATATPNSALIDALAGNEFATNFAQSRSMSPSAAYLYFAWPAAWGTPSFTVNGLPVTGWVQTTISYTNPSGNTTSFDVWRSQYPQTGTFSVVVS